MQRSVRPLGKHLPPPLQAAAVYCASPASITSQPTVSTSRALSSVFPPASCLAFQPSYWDRKHDKGNYRLIYRGEEKCQTIQLYYHSHQHWLGCVVKFYHFISFRHCVVCQWVKYFTNNSIQKIILLKGVSYHISGSTQQNGDIKHSACLIQMSHLSEYWH